MQLTPYVQSLSTGAPFLPKDETWQPVGRGCMCKLSGQTLGRDLCGSLLGYYGIGFEGSATTFLTSALPRTTWAWDEFEFIEFRQTFFQYELNSNHFNIWSENRESVQYFELIYGYAMWWGSIAAWIAGTPIPRFSHGLDFNLISRLGLPSELWREGYPDFRSCTRNGLLSYIHGEMQMEQQYRSSNILPPN